MQNPIEVRYFFAGPSTLRITAMGQAILNVAWAEWGDGWVRLGVNIEPERHAFDIVPFLTGETEVHVTYGTEERDFRSLRCQHRAISAFVGQPMQEEFWLATPGVSIPGIETEARMQYRLVKALETTLRNKGLDYDRT